MTFERQRRQGQAIDELAGERGNASQRAVRWGDLEQHPLIQHLFSGLNQVGDGGSTDLTQVEADIAALQSDMTAVQGDITQVQTDVVAAQSDATSAGNDATQALADAAAAQSVADAGAADWTTFKAEYQAVTVQVDGSGYISGWRATSWADLDGSGGGVLELLGDVIVPGTLSANRLAVGIQANDFINSDFMAPLAPNWVTQQTDGGAGAATSISINPAGDPYAWGAFPTLSAYQNDGSTTGFYKFTCRPVQDISGTLAPGFAVTAGERVSFSARLSAHRCTGSVEIFFYDGAGAFLSAVVNDTAPEWVGGNASPAATSSAGPPGSDTNPDLWDLCWVMADAPVGAAYYRPIFRKGPSGSGDANSELFVARPMHCRVHGDAVTPTPYSPEGTTLIDGDRLLTGTVTADKITVVNLSALGITVGTADIENAAIGSAQLAGIIESDDYVAGTSGWRINKDGTAEFQSITLRQIVESDIADGAVTDTTNTTGSASLTQSSTNTAAVSHAVTAVDKMVKGFVEFTVDAAGSNTFFVDAWLEKDSVRVLDLVDGDGSVNGAPKYFSFPFSSFGSGTFVLRFAYASGFATSCTITGARIVTEVAKK